MADLQFEIESMARATDAEAELVARLRIQNNSADPVHSITLRCQIQVDPSKRRYSQAEKSALADLFGAPERWAETVRPLMWANTQITVPPFSQSIVVDLPLAAFSEMTFGAKKYLCALEEGEIPIRFLFSGMVLYARGNRLQVVTIPWDREASFNLPPETWKTFIADVAIENKQTEIFNRTISELLDYWRKQEARRRNA